MKKYIDDKGKLLGREVNGVMLDDKGRVVARLISSSNRTVDGKGRNVGQGDLREFELGRDKPE